MVNPKSVLALACVAVFLGAAADACSCVHCSQSADFNGKSWYDIKTPSCEPGFKNVITGLSIAVSGTSTFNLRVQDSTSSSSSYPAGTLDKISCFNMPSNITIGNSPTIVVRAYCNNLNTIFSKCSMTWNVTSKCIPADYSWSTGAWSTCGPSCSGTRTVKCQNSDAVALDDANCPNSTKPAASSPCEGGECPYSWWNNSWTTCSTFCTQTRTVYCRDSANRMVGNANCTTAKPPVNQPCFGDYCHYQWVIVGTWSDCMPSCTKMRTVECHNLQGSITQESDCAVIIKPNTSQSCTDGACTTPPTGAENCICSCCFGESCIPSVIGAIATTDCGTCNRNGCAARFTKQCPAPKTSGTVSLTCNGSEYTDAASALHVSALITFVLAVVAMLL